MVPPHRIIEKDAQRTQEIFVQNLSFDKLVRKTRWSSFLLSARVDTAADGIILKEASGRYAVGMVWLLFGVACLAVMYFLAPQFSVKWFLVPLCGLFAFVLLCAAIRYRFAIHRVVWRRLSSTVAFQYGVPPFDTLMDLRRNDLQAELAMDPGLFGSKTGELLLKVALRNGEGPKVRIASSSRREDLLPAFNALREMIGASVDNSLTDIALLDGRTVRVPVTVTSRSSASFAADKLVFPSPDRALYTSTLGARLSG